MLTVYGERPITELCALHMGSSDFADMVGRAELTNGKRIDHNPTLKFKELFIEAPLGRQFGYVDLLLTHPEFNMMCEVKPSAYEDIHGRLEDQIPRYLEASRNPPEGPVSPLVKKVAGEISSRRNFLITMTGDGEFPSGLREYLKSLESEKDPSLGWLSYSFLREVLARDGLEIEGTPPHIWVSIKDGSSSPRGRDGPNLG